MQRRILMTARTWFLWVYHSLIGFFSKVFSIFNNFFYVPPVDVNSQRIYQDDDDDGEFLLIFDSAGNTIDSGLSRKRLYFRTLLIFLGSLLPLLFEVCQLRGHLRQYLEDRTWILLRADVNRQLLLKDVMLRVPPSLIHASISLGSEDSCVPAIPQFKDSMADEEWTDLHQRFEEQARKVIGDSQVRGLLVNESTIPWVIWPVSLALVDPDVGLELHLSLTVSYNGQISYRVAPRDCDSGYVSMISGGKLVVEPDTRERAQRKTPRAKWEIKPGVLGICPLRLSRILCESKIFLSALRHPDIVCAPRMTGLVGTKRKENLCAGGAQSCPALEVAFMTDMCIASERCAPKSHGAHQSRGLSSEHSESAISPTLFASLVDDDVTPSLLARFTVVAFVFSRWVFAEMRAIVEIFLPPFILGDMLSWTTVCSICTFAAAMSHARHWAWKVMALFGMVSQEQETTQPAPLSATTNARENDDAAYPPAWCSVWRSVNFVIVYLWMLPGIVGLIGLCPLSAAATWLPLGPKVDLDQFQDVPLLCFTSLFIYFGTMSVAAESEIISFATLSESDRRRVFESFSFDESSRREIFYVPRRTTYGEAFSYLARMWVALVPKITRFVCVIYATGITMFVLITCNSDPCVQAVTLHMLIVLAESSLRAILGLEESPSLSHTPTNWDSERQWLWTTRLRNGNSSEMSLTESLRRPSSISTTASAAGTSELVQREFLRHRSNVGPRLQSLTHIAHAASWPEMFTSWTETPHLANPKMRTFLVCEIGAHLYKIIDPADAVRSQVDAATAARPSTSVVAENLMCYICMASLPSAVMLPCLHGGCCIGCGEAILENAVVLRTNPKCPLCRQDVRAVGLLESNAVTSGFERTAAGKTSPGSFWSVKVTMAVIRRHSEQS